MSKIICIAAKIKKALGDSIERRLTGNDVRWLESMEPEERIASLKAADVVLCATLTKELSTEEKSLLGNVGFVQTMSAGVNQIDFSLVPHNINLHSNAGGWSHAIAEHALAMTLACSRSLRAQTEDLRDGTFNTYLRPMRLLDGATVVIFGWGGIGRAAGKLYKAFGSHLIGIGRTAPTDILLDGGYAFSEYKKVLPLADVLLLSCPSNNTTRNLLNSETLKLMKDDAILVNVARADLIDRDALEAHLKSHPNFRAGLDVWWKERRKYPAEGDSILKMNTIVGSPHSSHFYPEALAEAADNAITNIERYLKGETPKGKAKIEEYI